MKKIHGYILLSSLLFGLSCKKALKDVNDYFPKIKTVSAIIQQDGSVKVTGEIESPGKTKDADIDYAGFCADFKPEPKINSAQIIADINGNNFVAIYKADLFHVDSTYYFRAWATSEYGYAYGESIRLDSIIAPPVTPPCSLKTNTIDIGTSAGFSTYYLVEMPDEYNIRANSSAARVDLKFGSRITTGIYSTSTIYSPTPIGQVFVSLNKGGISEVLHGGSKVYINKVGAKSYEITICEAPWTVNGGSSKLYFNTRFTAPL